MLTMSRNQGVRGPGGWSAARGAVTAVAAVAVALVCLFVLLPMPASTQAAIREITLETRNMAFYLAGDDTPNPTIRLRAGEEVRFVLRNRDRGIKHNLAIDGWGLVSTTVAAQTTTTLRVRAPKRVGTQVYTCTPHREMMRGVLEVVDAL